MTANGPPPTSLRWDDPDGSWWIITRDHLHGRYDATKFTLGADGDERIVDDVGFGDWRITSVDELTEAMNRTLPDEVIAELAAAPLTPSDPTPSLADAAGTGSAAPPPAPAGERPMGTRYRIELEDSSWWELGWDKPLGTFFATRLIDAADGVGHEVLVDHGNGLSAITTIEQLGETIGRPVPPGITHELAADAAAHPFTTRPRFLPPETLVEPPPTDHLQLWEAHLRSWEARLEGWAASLVAQSRVEPLWMLPAGPVVDTLHTLQRDMAAEDNLTAFATGLGLPPSLVEALQAEYPSPLDVDQISQVCEALRCSPYDLWGPDLAQRILHAYGPERWPSHIEPLADGRDHANLDDTFLHQRLQRDTDHIISIDRPPASLPDSPQPRLPPPDEDPGEPPPRVTAVCYRRVGLLAEEPTGVIREVDPDAPPLSDVMAYHFTFRQVTEPREVRLYPPTGIAEPAPAGHDADPALASTADSFRQLPWLPHVDLVRFVDERGQQEWLGWNPDAEAWEAWDDPRPGYPGPGHDVLDPAGYTEPPVPEPQITGVAEAIEMDERYDSHTEQWVDFGPDQPGLLPDTDYAGPMGELDF